MSETDALSVLWLLFLSPVFIVLWIVFTILVGVVAHLKNRFVLGWVLISLLIIGPLIPLLILIFLSKLEENTTYYTYEGLRNLDNDSYVIYLTKKYKIEKIETLNKFTYRSKVFNDSKTVLEYVDVIEKESIPPIFLTKKREEPKNIDGKCPVCNSYINLKDEICWKCDASFSSTSLYKPVVLDSLELEKKDLRIKNDSTDGNLHKKRDSKYLIYFIIPLLVIVFFLLIQYLIDFIDTNDKSKKQNQSEIQNTTKIMETIKVDKNEVIDDTKTVSINNRWIGTWVSNEGSIIQFTISQVIVDKNEIYQWDENFPKLTIEKTAFYYGTFKKSDFNEFTPSDSQSKINLSNISNDTFRKIYTTDCWNCGSGDAADFYILDKVNIYLIFLDYSSVNMRIRKFIKINE